MTPDKELIEIDQNTSLFTLSDMKRCWEEAQDSMAKEYGFEGMDEILSEAPVYNTFAQFISEVFDIKIKP